MTGTREPPPSPAEARSEHGSLSTEAVVLIPMVVVLLLFAIGAARLVHARDQVDQAADQAATAAALGNGAAGQIRAENTARAVLAGDHDCADPHVTLRYNRAADSVTTTVSCTVALRDLLTAGFPGHETLTAAETAPRNLYAPGN